MKILYANNYNYLRGGAESVLFAEKALLERKGQCVTVFSRKHLKNLEDKNQRYFPSELETDKISFSAKNFRSLINIFYSFESRKCLNRLLKIQQLDIAHAHNVYGRLTTSIFDCLTKRGIPIVMTLHDYKVICPNYKLMHHGKICEDCRNSAFYSAVLNRCHKDSIIASSIVSLETCFNYLFKKYKRNVSLFISPSRFLRNKLIEFGWPEDRILYTPNFISIDDFIPNYQSNNYFLYLGRLSSEKGIATLIRSFLNLKQSDIKLNIVGEGPLKAYLRKIARNDRRISFLGYLNGRTLADVTRNALAVVVPSEWYENAPLSILEAMAFGKPVIGAKIGGIPEMIEDGRNGLLFESGNTHELTFLLNTVCSMKKSLLFDMGFEARQKVEAEYNADLHYDRLITIYRNTIRNHQIN